MYDIVKSLVYLSHIPSLNWTSKTHRKVIFLYIISFTSSEENNSLDKYYCVIRLDPLLKIRELPVNVSFMSTPYYSIAIDIVRNCKNVNHFPIITFQNIYECMKKIETPLFGEKYPLFNWVKHGRILPPNLSILIIEIFHLNICLKSCPII